MKTLALLALLMFAAAAFAQEPEYLKHTEIHNLPDAPSTLTQKYDDVHYDKETGQFVATAHVKVFDKWFFLTHGAYLAANVFDIETSVRGKCMEGGSDSAGAERPTRSGLYSEDMIIFAAITTFDAVVKKYVPGGKYIALGPPTYGAVQHIRGGVSWYTTPGCM